MPTVYVARKAPHPEARSGGLRLSLGLRRRGALSLLAQFRGRLLPLAAELNVGRITARQRPREPERRAERVDQREQRGGIGLLGMTAVSRIKAPTKREQSPVGTWFNSCRLACASNARAGPEDVSSSRATEARGVSMDCAQPDRSCRCRAESDHLASRYQ